LSQPLTRDEARAGLVYLLELRWASRVFRWTSGESVDVSSDAGTLHYRAGLPIDWTDGSDLLSIDSEQRSISFGALWMPEDVDVAELVAAGHDLASAVGEVSLWSAGRTYEERIPLLEGRVLAPTYGGKDEPIGLTLEERLFDDASTLIPVTARVTPTTWPDADPAMLGRAYPLVVGKPGLYLEADGTASTTTGSPALLVGVTAKQFLVAGHRTNATQVRIINVTKGEARNETIELMTDGLGREVTIIDGSGTGLSVVEGDEYWVRWDDGEALVGEESTAPIRQAGDVLRYVLERSTLRVDRGAMASVISYLNRYRLDFYADDPEVSAWDWLADNLLPLLPVSVVGGPRGLRPVLFRTDARALDAVDAIEAGPDAVRSSLVGYSVEEAVQVVQVAFAPRGGQGDHLRTVTLSGDPNEPDAGSHLALRASSTRYQVRRVLRIETDVVYDSATAQLIASTLASTYALPRREVVYELDPRRFGTLEPGQVVTLTDPELHLVDAVALVQSIAWGSVTMSVGLVLIEDPARDR
jgi:hypothetical protein